MKSSRHNEVNPLAGVSCFVEGLRRASSSEVRPFIIGPALVSLVIIGIGMYVAFGYIAEFATYLQTAMPEWLSFLNVILEPLLYLFGVLIGAWLFGFLATIIGSPFLGELALRVERVSPNADRRWYHEIGSALLRELRKLRYHLPRILLLILITFIPVLNAFAPFLWLGFGAWMMAVQFCDFTVENRQGEFSETLAILARNRGAALGFGLCATLGMSVPFLNFLVAPIATVGATLLMNQFQESQIREV